MLLASSQAVRAAGEVGIGGAGRQEGKSEEKEKVKKEKVKRENVEKGVKLTKGELGLQDAEKSTADAGKRGAS